MDFLATLPVGAKEARKKSWVIRVFSCAVFVHLRLLAVKCCAVNSENEEFVRMRVTATIKENLLGSLFGSLVRYCGCIWLARSLQYKTKSKTAVYSPRNRP
jgi:hypothetical protein